MLPNFFIAGTAKAGTTSLFHYLDEHPEVFMSPVKEPNFFSYNEIVGQNLYYAEKGIASREEYEKLFSRVTTQKVIGEASVSYLFYPAVASKIKKLIPHAKIIIVLRNPLERGFSHYLMDARLGYVELTYEDIIYKKTAHPRAELYYQQYVGLGFYYQQVKRYLDTFGPDQVKIFLHEDLMENISRVIRELYHYVELDGAIMPDVARRYNTYRKPKNKLISALYASKNIRTLAKSLVPSSLQAGIKSFLLVQEAKPHLAASTAHYVKALYRDDVAQLARLIGRDLTSWSE